MKTEIHVPEKCFPQNKEGKSCDCMNREYLLSYKKCVMHWIAAPGCHVSAGDTVCEVEAEKKIFEVPAPVSGVLCEQCIGEKQRFDGSATVGYIENDE